MAARGKLSSTTLPPTRSAIVDAADALFYRRGYANTSFADIAEAVGISRGNFYYHFKTKDEILDAVIASRIDGTRAMLDQWRTDAASPEEGIRTFLRIVKRNRVDIAAHGCPVGTLTAEMAKLGHPARTEAAALFTLFRQWLHDRFQAMGATGPEADALALQALIWSQGVATLGNALGDTAMLHAEVLRIERWLDEQAQRLALPRERTRGPMRRSKLLLKAPT